MIVKRAKMYHSSLRIVLSQNELLNPRATLSRFLAGKGDGGVKVKDEMLTGLDKKIDEETGSRMASQMSQEIPMLGLQTTLMHCSETDQ